MGCDIHFTIEANIGERESWVGVYSTVYSPTLTVALYRAPQEGGTEPALASTCDNRPLLKDRDYEWFNLLAGVRGEGPGRASFGVPADASPLTNHSVARWEGDGHSHHHCPLALFAETFAEVRDDIREALATVALKNDGRAPTPEELLCGSYHPEDVEYRVVFWFDN